MFERERLSSRIITVIHRFLYSEQHITSGYRRDQDRKVSLRGCGGHSKSESTREISISVSIAFDTLARVGDATKRDREKERERELGTERIDSCSNGANRNGQTS